MIAALLILQAAQGPVVAPEIPPGANSTFLRNCQEVCEALDHKDWAAAQKALVHLPTTHITLQWDDKAVPAGRRSELAKARDEAIKLWSDAIPEVKVTIAAKGRIKISFAPDLPPNPDTVGPAGAVFFTSNDPKDPAVEGVIALVRTEQRFSIESKEVTNEVGYAIGTYLGLERKPGVGAAMSRTEEMYRRTFLVATPEMQVVRETQKVVAQLTDYTKRKVQVKPAKPQIFLSQSEFKPEPVSQGDPLVMNLSVTNRGNSTLRFFVIPDCTCFSLAYDRSIPPGESRLVRIGIDTLHFTGNLEKNLHIQSNDPDAGVRKINFRMRVDPMYRFLGLQSNDVMYVDQTTEGEVFFIPNPKKPLVPTGAVVEGVNGTATLEPWEGSLPDRASGEAAQPRKGYRIKVSLKGDIPPGRAGVNVVVKTNDPEWPAIRTSFMVQRGIISLPIVVYFGEISKNPTRAWTLVTRPGRPFKITKVDSDNPFFKGEVEPTKEGDYKLIVQYLGGSDFGDIRAKMILSTDDPSQPTVEIPVQALVRG
ncbi:MAG: DUF1573 domain-containing protein [Fimbriimonadaceae bacterium]|nr:DUF1573 domain-containing protein [Fimbriimonadaceae bacterium]